MLHLLYVALQIETTNW